VPYHIKWQSQYTNVCWYNLSVGYAPPDDLKDLYFGTKDIPNGNIGLLPEPFSHPDLIIFHGIFFYNYCKIARQLHKLGIKYVVVPHGSLTESSIKQKAIKKYLGFRLLFGKFIKEARAIQYLTEGEHNSSGDRWNKHFIIVPNGCEIPAKQKKQFRDKDLIGVFIGRKSVYYKGLDLLIEACNSIKENLENINCKINIYGPEEHRSNEVLNKAIQAYGLNEYISLYDSMYSEDKVNVLLNSDFFILTSRTEGHPVALIEALSYGIPSLVTTGTNMTEEISGSNAGWIAEPNVESIAKALTRILNNIDQIPIKGNNAHNLSLNYEWSNIAQKAINKYKSLF
jgi:glycosyltransferase involved in cell wall biosynthesis